MIETIKKKEELQAAGHVVLHVGDLETAKRLELASLHKIPNLRHLGFGDFADDFFYYERTWDGPDGRLYIRRDR